MNKIIEKKQISKEVFQLTVESPLIAKERNPGQFILLQVHEDGERIPLTIADANPEEGTITLIFQEVGKTTHLLAELNVGDSVLNIVGPLGKPTHIEQFGKVICIGGGIGVAPLFPIAKALKEAGNQVISIIGARTKDLLILEDKIESISDEIVVCTDDGSKGKKCLVTDPLKEFCENDPGINLVVAIGPAIMMKACSLVTKEFSIKTIVSLNTIMVDGTGMCGGCRVTVGDETKFVCVDGPEFDGHMVDFDNMINRLNAYRDIEKNIHKCHLDEFH